MRFKQILVRHNNDLLPVRLGKPLNPRLAGRQPLIVVRIEKPAGYQVTTICRNSGRPQRFSFSEEQVQEAEPDVQV